MAERPIPTIDQAANGAVWFTTQAGIAATILAVVSIALATAMVLLFRSCRAEMAGAWARVTAISEARSVDSKEMAQALTNNTVALARVSERVEIADRRGSR